MLKNWTVDKLIITSTTLCVLAEIAINFINSYGHIYILGLWFGEYGTDARLTPIGIDLLLLAFAEINLFLARKGRYVVNKRGKKRPEFRWPRWVLGGGVGGTVAANGAYGFHWGWTGGILAMGSAVLLFFTVEGGMLLLRVAAEDKDDKPAASPSGPSAAITAPKLAPWETARYGFPIQTFNDEPGPVDPEAAEAARLRLAEIREARSIDQEGKAQAPSLNTDAWRGLNGIGLRNGTQ